MTDPERYREILNEEIQNHKDYDPVMLVKEIRGTGEPERDSWTWKLSLVATTRWPRFGR